MKHPFYPCLIACIMLLAGAPISTMAAKVSVADAQTVALNFYKATTGDNPHMTITAELSFTQSENNGAADFYVFNMEPLAGFVIVSATDNVTPVLAYSTESNFKSNCPEIGIKAWLHQMAGQVHQAVARNYAANERTVTLWKAYRTGERPAELKSTSVAPLLTTLWDQFPYYNMYCPQYGTSKGYCITGCCATAMAQIMKYWSYPAHGSGSFSYGDSICNGYNYNIGTVSADFSSSNYQWSDMPAQVTGNANDTAVALLMYDCGTAAETNFGLTESSAYFAYHGQSNVLNAWTKYFNYDADSIDYVFSMYYDSGKWLPLIEKELNMGRPVMYTGQDTGNIGGHAWVCDGYDANEMLHMNWGWSGYDNGYFTVSDINPNPYNFSWYQSAIKGIQPPKKTTDVNSVSSPGLTFKLFPNPTTSGITVSGNTGGTEIEYAVYNVLGDKVISGFFTSYSEWIQFHTTSKGVYLLKLRNGQAEETHRFVVD